VAIGVSFGAHSSIGWLEDHGERLDCLEIAVEGFFARPSPYLAWLSSRFSVIARARDLSIGTPGPLSDREVHVLAEVSATSNSRVIVHPLGFSRSEAIRLGTVAPIGLTAAALGLVAEHVAEAAERCGRPGVLEPITAPLRVRGTIAETDFLNRVCRQAGCRLLIDVTTLLVSSRHRGFEPRAWLGDIDEDLIAAARIGGCSLRDARWHPDPEGDLDEDAWELMRDLVARARPDVLLLGPRRSPPAADARDDLERLREVAGEARGIHHVDRTSRPEVTPTGPVVASRPRVQTRRVPDDEPRVVQPASDGALFVLGREGVFVSEARRELSLFNTAATLVWCLVEQGLAVEAIIEAYRKASGLAAPEAARDVGTILQQWYGLGYLTGPVVWDAPDVPLTTALAQVLTNARLREEFRGSPDEVAHDLRVAADEIDIFVQLDPDELDAQARETNLPVTPPPGARAEIERSNPRGEADRQQGTAPLARGAVPPARLYRVLTTTFSIRVESDALARHIDRALAHLQCSAGAPDVTLKVRASGPDWIVLDDDVEAHRCRRPEEVLPIIKQRLRETATNRHDYVIKVHAGVTSLGGACVVLPGSAGSGKTTLTAGLIRAGATYFSDELALLEGRGLAVRPFLLTLTVKDGSLAALGRLYPEIEGLTVHLREDHVRVRYLPRPTTSLPADDEALPVRWMVFPRYDAAARTALRPLDRAAALEKLLAEAHIPPERLDRHTAESIVRWMRTVDCFDLDMSSLVSAVDLVMGLAR
jgi:uncharacterized protein (UPF0276 family)